MKQQSARIVVDGGDRLREAGGYAAEHRRRLAELKRQLEFGRARMSWWARLWLEMKLRRAVRTELKEKFPPGALYLAA